jgi:hypothetical protein
MTITKAAATLLKVLKANTARKRGEYKLTPMLWGPPGVGKSAVVRQAMRHLNEYALKDLRLSTMLPVDVRGVPALPKDTDAPDARFRFIPPEFLPQDSQKTLLFFDEVNTAPPSNQVVAYEIALDYAMGGHPLPEGTLVVLAGNRTEDKGATFDMPAPLANRLLHIQVEPDVDSFFDYGIERNLNPMVLGFLKFRRPLLYVPPSGKEKAFPTPRSWEFVSILLQAESMDHQRVDVELLAGVVGQGAATEFASYIKMHKHLPDLDAILDKGGVFTHQEDSVKYAYLIGLTARFMERPTEKRANHYVTALTTLPEELQAMGVYMTRSPHKPSNALVHVTKAPDFIKIRDAVRGVLSPES